MTTARTRCRSLRDRRRRRSARGALPLHGKEQRRVLHRGWLPHACCSSAGPDADMTALALAASRLPATGPAGDVGPRSVRVRFWRVAGPAELERVRPASVASGVVDERSRSQAIALISSVASSGQRRLADPRTALLSMCSRACQECEVTVFLRDVVGEGAQSFLGGAAWFG